MSGTNDRNYILYLHTTPSRKRYYGITKLKPEYRWNNGKGYKTNQYFTRAINKYGWENIKHEVLFEDLTESEAKELEQYMIQWYDTANSKYGYNITLGGESNNGVKRSEEWKKEQSKRFSGENNPMYGKVFTDEHRRKIGESRKGEKNHMFHKRGKDNPFSKPVICITTKRIFESQTNASRFYNIKCQGNISQCCSGKIKSAGKYNGQKLVWRYLNYKHNKTYRLA